MSAVAVQPRTNKLKLAPQPGESQVSFIERGDRELYAKIPDTAERSRHLLQCWTDAGGDRELAEITAKKFPAQEFHTVRNLPIFTEHQTTDVRGEKRTYSRKELATIVRRCNERILDTGDFAVLSAGHTPDSDAMATGAQMPDVLGYVGPFRLGKIGNRKPRWAIFADEHYHRSDLDKVKKRPRRSPEVFLDDMILDPIAALGAETPRLDTGIVRNCRTSDGRVVMKYSAMCFPAGGNTSPQSFRGKKEDYAAGENPMNVPANNDLANQDNAAALDNLGDEQLQKIIMGVAAAVMESKPMQWILSQMPPDWSPGEGETDDIPADAGEGAVDNPGEVPGDAGLADQVPGDGIPAGDESLEPQLPPDESHFDPEAGMMAGQPELDGGDQPPAPSADPEDAATDSELGDMDDEEKEKYAAFDSAGRRGFLWSWRRHRRHNSKYSADEGDRMMAATATPPAKDNYSRLANENKQLNQRIETLERENRHKDRYSKLADLRKTRAFDLQSEHDDVKDLPEDAFDRHCRRIKENYSRIPQEGGMPTLPTDDEAVTARTSEQMERFSKLARERALKNNNDKRNKHMSHEQALELVMSEHRASSAAK